jgi:hypothetical protein
MQSKPGVARHTRAPRRGPDWLAESSNDREPTGQGASTRTDSR